MSSVHFPAELRRLIRVRAGECCEYCLAPENLCFHAHQVGHIIAQKHDGKTIAENLALSCIARNQFKGMIHTLVNSLPCFILGGSYGQITLSFGVSSFCHLAMLVALR